MAFVDGFEYDLFISYAHLDNQLKWIDNFHRLLEIRLGEILGMTPSICRDSMVSSDAYFEEGTEVLLEKTAVFIPVMSPRYEQSQRCRDEFEAFRKAYNKTKRDIETTRPRIIKVYKTPVELHEHSSDVLKLLGFSFFDVSREGDHPKEYAPNDDQNTRFFEVLTDLAYHLSDLLKDLKLQSRPEAGPAGVTGKGTVFLAETVSELRMERDQIQRELLQHGYAVLPENPLPLEREQLAGEIRKLVTMCDLSIHLLGQQYGIIPEGSERSIVELQASYVAECFGTERKQLIWIPEGLVIDKLEDNRQKQFIASLLNDPGEAELLRLSLEDLKTEVLDALSPVAEPIEQNGDRDAPFVYLVYNPIDETLVKPLYDYLFGTEELAVESPLFSGDETTRRQDHEETLRSCDAVLVFQGEAPQAWLRTNIRDLRKAAGFGRATPLDIKAVYLGSPETAQKASFQTRLVDLVLKHFGSFTPSVLTPFIESIRIHPDGI